MSIHVVFLFPVPPFPAQFSANSLGYFLFPSLHAVVQCHPFSLVIRSLFQKVIPEFEGRSPDCFQKPQHATAQRNALLEHCVLTCVRERVCAPQSYSIATLDLLEGAVVKTNTNQQIGSLTAVQPAEVWSRSPNSVMHVSPSFIASVRVASACFLISDQT